MSILTSILKNGSTPILKRFKIFSLVVKLFELLIPKSGHPFKFFSINLKKSW